jgi:hypothetical protein
VLVPKPPTRCHPPYTLPLWIRKTGVSFAVEDANGVAFAYARMSAFGGLASRREPFRGCQDYWSSISASSRWRRHWASRVPTTIRGTRSILRSDSWLFRQGPIAVHIGAPIEPKADDFRAAVALRAAARRRILERCGEPDLSHERVVPTP